MYQVQPRPRLMLLDDAPVNLNSLGSQVSNDYELYYIKDFSELKANISIYEPDCIIVDLDTLDIDAVELCSWLKEQEKFQETPLILIGPIYYAYENLHALGLDGIDVITKPYNPALIHMKISSHMNASEQRRHFLYKEDMLKKASKTIQLLERELALKNFKDDLSGLSNRRSLMEKAQHEFKLSQRLSREVTVMMMDLDRFKNINDTFGPDFGDMIIQEVGKTCIQVLRETDLVGRMGGDEFAVMLPGTSLENGIFVAEKLRSHIHHIKDHVNGPEDVKISLSVGITSLDSNMDTVEELFRRANQALIQAKRKGRDCVISL